MAGARLSPTGWWPWASGTGRGATTAVRRQRDGDGGLVAVGSVAARRWRYGDGELASWRAGELASWRAGELASWRAGELASWRAGE
ncbi:hypothetical protein, partial [Streptomyces sp. NPDC057877]|uniref:hypothetical protein n=1 Tax=Streptomyces sp. NPDC057877 TaxID=3346269 RepID=UPI0036897267